MEFRRDIEGLRAVAIAPIVLYHAGLSVVEGGFVGVDIFFVVSGYLITSLIYPSILDRRFSTASFYFRRIVRIFPALLLMLALVCLFGALTLFPIGLRALGQAAAAAAAFGSNIYFWRTLSYFDPTGDLHPLLHTWSLGVEEQFYLFYPVALILLARLGPLGFRFGLAALVCGSFALAMAMTALGRETATFYLLPTRAWELGLGGLAAVGVLPRLEPAWARNAMSVIGASLIVLSIFLIDVDRSFPAPWALPPALGALLLIAYGRDAATRLPLTWAPLRFIGRISYSLYLWHWPIMAFYRLENGSDLVFLESAALVGASLVAATLSYWLVEEPVLKRVRSASPDKWKIAVGLSASAFIAASGILLAANAGSLRSLPSAVDHVVSFGGYMASANYREQFRPGTCFMDRDFSRRTVDGSCLAVDAGRSNIIIAGDSFAAHYWRAFALEYPERHVVQATAPGCRPLLHPTGPRTCRAVMEAVMGPLTDNEAVDAVVLSGRWVEEDLQNLAATVRHLDGKHIPVLVVGPSLEVNGVYPELLGRSLLTNRPSILEEAVRSEIVDRDRRMEEIVEAAGGLYVSPYRIQCPEGSCRQLDEKGDPPLFDCCHLTLQAAQELVREFPVL